MDLRKGIEKVYIKEEKVELKKGKLGWGVVYPVKNEDGSINWYNLLTGGHWAKPILIILFVIIIFLAMEEYYSNIKFASACIRALPDNINLNLYLDNPTLVNNLTQIIK